VKGVEDTGEWATVYNLSVAECHTYFVGGSDWGFSVWAHNQCVDVPGPNPNKLAGETVAAPSKGVGGVYTGQKGGKIKTGSTDDFSARYRKFPEGDFKITTEYRQTRFAKPDGVDDSAYRWTARRQRRFDEEYIDRTISPEARYRSDKGDSPVSPDKWRQFRHIFGYGDVPENFGH
jgi:hypothetical protein